MEEENKKKDLKQIEIHKPIIDNNDVNVATVDYSVLKTKTGSVWGSDSDIDRLKMEYIERSHKKIEDRKRTILNFSIAILVLLVGILYLIFQKKYNLWFWNNYNP